MMLRVSTIERLKLSAESSFKLSDVEFEGFEDVGKTDLMHTLSIKKEEEITTTYEDEFKQLDIWAHFSIKYKGTPPDSYRVLNSILMDWVEENEDELKKEINPKLISFLKEDIPDIDVSDLKEDFDDYIWEEQVDYMPGIDEDEKKIHFFVELVLEIDEEEGN